VALSSSVADLSFFIDEQLQSPAYFARPFANWERGINENFNVLLRQYIQKKRSMSTVTDKEIRINKTD